MSHLLLAVIYLAFISLGLPDSILGAAWPSMFENLNVPVSFAGIISMIISAGTIISSLFSDKLTRKIGAGKITAISVILTAISLFGFSISNSFWQLCLWSIPFGLGAGSIDAALNNYVALHYASRHMSWLHCMWGIGAATGPYIMGYALTAGHGWPTGYKIISLIQIILSAIIFISLPLWKNRTNEKTENIDCSHKNTLSLVEIFKIPGAKQVLVMFFCYCALESTSGLWAASYLVLYRGVSPEIGASLATMFYTGITIGRGISGFLTIKLNDKQMIRLGQCLIFVGILALSLPFGKISSIVGFLIIGLGCAPIYPCIIHSTPTHFGEDKSQAIIGVQMASAYTGSCLMPPIFGLIANNITVALLPIFLLGFLVLMIFMYSSLLKQTKKI